MTRRYLRKLKSSEDQGPSKNIKKNHVAMNLEIDKAMAPQERVIVLDDKPSTNTRKKILHESIRNALDAAGNTCLSIRFFNMNVKRNISKIEKTKKLFNVPYVEIETLEFHGLKKEKKLIQIPINNLTSKEKEELKNYFFKKV
ncbi:MAG: hypothetical protein ACE5RN_07215 [Nitrosopumilaceae archaeon]